MGTSDRMFGETLDRLTQAHEKIGKFEERERDLRTAEVAIANAHHEIALLNVRLSGAEEHRPRVEELWKRAKNAAEFIGRFSSVTEEDRKMLNALLSALENTKDYDEIPF